MGTSTIGTTARNYSTMQAWEDAIPASLAESYTGECYNDSEFTAQVIISGHTGGSATNFIKLTAAAGQSFQDHANVRTNALLYDQAKGVGILGNTAEALVWVDNDYVYVERLQLNRNGATYTKAVLDFGGSTANSYAKDCIVAKTYSGTQSIINLRDSYIVNLLIYDTGATPTNEAFFGNAGALAQNCTVVRVGTTGGTGINAAYSGFTLKNSAVFNFTTAFVGTFGASSGYNCTDAASAPGSNNQVSKTFSNQFENTSSDLRLKSGSDCIGTGNTNATYPNDISAFVRGTTTAGDSSCWEFSSAAAASSVSNLGSRRNRPGRGPYSSGKYLRNRVNISAVFNAPAPSVTVALTGQAATAGIGTVRPVKAKAITGNSITSARGSVAVVRAKALTGNASTSAAGTVRRAMSKALTGIAATLSAGTVRVVRSKALTGLAITLSAGNVSVSGALTIALTGIAATLSAGSLAISRVKSISGSAATASPGTVKNAISKALTGLAITSGIGSVLARLSKALTGLAATLSAGTISAGTAKTAALTGVSATAAAGSLTKSVTIALVGVSVTVSPGAVSAGGSATGGNISYGIRLREILTGLRLSSGNINIK